MPFSIRPYRRFPGTMLSLNTLTKMAKALKVTVAELVKQRDTKREGTK